MVVVFFLAALISYTDRLILSVLVDPLRTSLGLSDSDVSLLQGPAFTLVYVFASLPFGRLADRGRRKALLLAGAAMWCLATVFCGLASSFSALMMGRVLVGVSEATLVPAAVSMIADSFPQQGRGTAVGAFAMGTVIGGPVGISIGGLLLTAATSGRLAGWPIIDGLEPWRMVLVIVGVMGLVVPALLLTVSEPTRLETAADASLKAAITHFTHDRRLLLPLYLALALLAIGDYGLVSWVPTSLSRRFAWQSDEVGVAFGLITSIAGVAGALGGGWFADVAERRGGARARFALCITAAGFALAGAALISAGHAAFVLTGLGVWVFASTSSAVAGIAVLQALVPNQFRGTGVSLLTFCNTLVGLGCGPTLVALATENIYGAPAAVGFAISTVVVPASLLACLGFIASRRALALRYPAG
jgi:MFS family permease